MIVTQAIRVKERLRIRSIQFYRGVSVNASSSIFERHMAKRWGIKEEGPDTGIRVKVTEKESVIRIHINLQI